MYKTHNDLVAAVAALAQELADLPMPQLRLRHPDVMGVGTDYEAKGATLGKTKGRIIADILYDQFHEDIDRDFAE